MEVTASMKPEKEAAQEVKRRDRRPPLLAVMIVRKWTNVVSPISIDELCNRIYAGVLDNDKNWKFWVDRDLVKNCFLLLAKAIDGINYEERYWKWIDGKEKSYKGEEDVAVRELVTVCWLELSATISTIQLSAKTTYEVAFVLKRGERSQGMHREMNLSLTLPDGTRLERTDYLEEKLKGEWIDILVGTFVMTPKNVGKINVNYTQYGNWMGGLIVKGIVFRPKD